jgi:hypothetical protein
MTTIRPKLPTTNAKVWRPNRNRHLYLLVAREIEKIVADAQTRLNGATMPEAARQNVFGAGVLTRPLRQRET